MSNSVKPTMKSRVKWRTYHLLWGQLGQPLWRAIDDQVTHDSRIRRPCARLKREVEKTVNAQLHQHLLLQVNDHLLPELA